MISTRAPAIDRLAQRLKALRPALIVAPPRSASTAFARALASHSAFDQYVHEPCDLRHHQNAPIESVLEALDELGPRGVIKEMTFQMDDPALSETFLSCCRRPVLFLVRAPMLTIESRIRMVLSDLAQSERLSPEDQSRIRAAVEAREYQELDAFLTAFPLNRTGWTDLKTQLAFCRAESIEHLVIEATDFRERPTEIMNEVCARMGLAFEPEMLDWKRRADATLGGLERFAKDQANWYKRVRESPGVLPPDSATVTADRLPPRFRTHLIEAEAIYEDALKGSPG